MMEKCFECGTIIEKIDTISIPIFNGFTEYFLCKPCYTKRLETLTIEILDESYTRVNIGDDLYINGTGGILTQEVYDEIINEIGDTVEEGDIIRVNNNNDLPKYILVYWHGIIYEFTEYGCENSLNYIAYRAEIIDRAVKV